MYRDEQQRQYVATGILMASYFGCRPVSTFDTRIKFEEDDATDKPVDRATVADAREDYSDDSTDEDTSDVTDWDDDRSTLVDSDSDLDDDDDDASAYSDGDDDTDSDSGTDDEVDAGRDDTGTLLWRYITFIITPYRIPGEPNVLFAKVIITYTKGEDNYPREKTFIIKRKDNPLLCLLDYLLSLALYNNIFAAGSLQNISNIFRAKIPPGKKSLQLKIKSSPLDIPVFRIPGCAADGFRTSPTEPLHSSTWLRYL
ncbi:hypothetical protein ABVK25_010905 [Lepraria finkii]|uniref:Uncharacterized protein n=1 Tax=Lepraria finkii TaxID=1340010 RepID=A0ABR4AT13_9LECA